MKADIPFISTIAKNKIYKKTGKFESLEEQEQIPVQKEPQDNQQALNAKDKEIESLKGQISLLRQKVENEKNRAVKPIPNPETGEVPLTIGLANKLLKDKEEEERKEKKEKENSEKIKQLSKETKLESFTRKFLQHLNESDASDKAKSLGLDYMSFGRYGKGGKVTHKSVGGSLQALSKKDQEKEKDVTKTPKAEPKKSKPDSDDEVDIKIKSRNFLKDLENSNFEDDEGFPIEIIFDEGESGIDGIQSAIEKAQEMGLEDLANDLDDVAYHIGESEPDEAQAKYQDLMAKYSGKPVKAVEYADKVDKAVMMMSDQTYTNDPAPFANDLMSTMSIVKKMVDSDKTEGSSGSGMSNGSKGFRPEVIDTLQSLSDISDYAAELEKEYKGKDEKVREILGDLQGEINFITDEDSDHDNYTKSYKVNSVVDTIIDMAKELQKRLKVKKESVNYPEGARLTYESIQAVKNKADKTGMPYGILKKVYDRGMAAWRGGHRPGASQQQWALARVNSFVTKSSGTWGGADKDLAAKVKGSKK
jgi:predicted DNA binding CopG/RHH family protein